MPGMGAPEVMSATISEKEEGYGAVLAGSEELIESSWLGRSEALKLCGGEGGGEEEAGAISVEEEVCEGPEGGWEFV